MPQGSEPDGDRGAATSPPQSRHTPGEMHADRERRLARLERMANTLDTKFRLPLVGIPVGWDSILGLVPGIGDLVTVGPGAWTIIEGHRLGARKRALARMTLNTGIDAVLGGIPLIGDAFDVFFKSHRRNVALLRRDLAERDLVHQCESKNAVHA